MSPLCPAGGLDLRRAVVSAERQEASLRVGLRLGDLPAVADHAVAPREVLLVLRLDLVGRQVVLRGLHLLQRLHDVALRGAGLEALDVGGVVGGRVGLVRIGHAEERQALVLQARAERAERGEELGDRVLLREGDGVARCRRRRGSGGRTCRVLAHLRGALPSARGRRARRWRSHLVAGLAQRVAVGQLDVDLARFDDVVARGLAVAAARSQGERDHRKARRDDGAQANPPTPRHEGKVPKACRRS